MDSIKRIREDSNLKLRIRIWSGPRIRANSGRIRIRANSCEFEPASLAIARIGQKWRPLSESRTRRVRQLGGWCLSERPASRGDLFGAVILVDAAKDGVCYRVGGVLPAKQSVRTWVCPDGPCNQQVAELMGIAWAVRLAVRLGWKVFTVFADSMVGIA